MDEETEVELLSLKDVVWRLTTRVFVLENFITKTFGDVLVKVRRSSLNVPKTRRRRSPSKENYSEDRNKKGPRIQTYKSQNTSKTNDSIRGPKRNSSKRRNGSDFESDHSSVDSDLFIESQEHREKRKRRCTRGASQIHYNEDNSESDEDWEGSIPNSKDSDFNPLLIPKVEPATVSEVGSDFETEYFQSKMDSKPKSMSREKTLSKTETESTKKAIVELPFTTEGVGFVQSQRGGEKLTFENFVYCKTNYSKGVTYWRCEQRSKSCNGRGIYKDNEGFRVTREHDHEADSIRMEVLLLKNKIRELSGSDDLPSDILQNALTGVSEKAASRIKKEICKRSIRYHRQKMGIYKKRSFRNPKKQKGTTNQNTEEMVNRNSENINDSENANDPPLENLSTEKNASFKNSNNCSAEPPNT